MSKKERQPVCDDIDQFSEIDNSLLLKNFETGVTSNPDEIYRAM